MRAAWLLLSGWCLGCGTASPASTRSPESPSTAAQPAPAPSASSAAAASASDADPLAPSSRLRAMYPEQEGKAVLPTAQDLSGVWHEVPDSAAAGPLRRPPPCYEGLGWVAIEQSGSRVHFLLHFAEPAQGIRPEYDIDQYERGAGERKGDAIELTAELVRETRHHEQVGPARRQVLQRPRYRLAFDRTTGHLVGTRDAKPLRLAPLLLITPPGNPTMRDRCGGPPP